MLGGEEESKVAPSQLLKIVGATAAVTNAVTNAVESLTFRFLNE